MDINWLRTFVEIVNEGSFKGAAQKLYTSNATISLRMSNLTQELRFDPFVKKRGEIVLSDKGTELLTIAREMMILDEKIERLKNQTEHMERLKIGTGSSTAVQNLLQPVIRFRNLYPDVEITLEVYPAHEIMDKLQRGTLDMGVTWENVNVSNLVQEELANLYLYAVMLPENPLFGKKEVTMEELLPYPMILRQKGAVARKAPDDWLARHNKKAMIILVLNNSDHIIKALVSGYGGRYAVGIITSLSRHPDSTEYGIAKIKNLPSMHMYAYTHRSVDSASTKKFINLLKSTW